MTLALFGLSLGDGCSRQQPAAATVAPRDPAYYGKLAGLRASPDQRLRDELARIVEEGGTPEQLGRSNVAEKDNAAVVLMGLFPAGKVELVRKATEELMPPGAFKFDAAKLKKAVELRTRYDAQRLRAREGLRRPRCDFGIAFEAGFLADVKFIDVAWICARLEAYRAAEALEDDDLGEAIESLRSMLRLASCLGGEKHAEARLEAAFLRTRAFAVLQTIVEEPRLGRSHLETLLAMVQDQLRSWPSDANAWIGDRAAGMHAYEMVRDGVLSDLLTPEELVKFTKQRGFVERTRSAKDNADKDELFYLETMWKIIEGCKRPHHLRAAMLEAVAAELQRLQDSSDYPLVAAELLLPGVGRGLAIEAQDRANWEAWGLALVLAAGRAMPPDDVNPFSGERYRVIKQDGQILVGNFGSSADDQAWITVPALTAAGTMP